MNRRISRRTNICQNKIRATGAGVWVLLGCFLFFIAAACGFLLIYPYTVYPLAIGALAARRPEPRREDATGGSFPATDIVLCAHDEEACLADKIDNCLRLAAHHGNIRVHVYSDGSTDRTAAIVRRYGARIDGVIAPHRAGKSTGINRLLARCTGEFVVFTDANVIIDEDAFANFRRYFADPRIGCVTGRLTHTNAHESAVADIGACYRSFEDRLKRAESRSGSAMGADGALFAIRRRLFRPVPADIIDDMFTSLSILCDGYRIVQADDWTARERGAIHRHEEFRRKMRIGCRAFNCHRLLWPRLKALPPLDLFKYLSHKPVRWLGGLWLTAGAAAWLAFCIVAGWPWLALASLAAPAMLVAAPALRPFREALIAIVATSLGVWQSLRGRRYQTWTVAASTRGV